MMNSLLSRVESFLCRPWLNLFLTIYLNFRLCNIKDAIKLPIIVYGRICFANTLGNFIFPNGCYRGIITIGKTEGHFFSQSRSVYMLLANNSKVICLGKVSIGEGVSLRLTKGAELHFASNVIIGDNVEIMCENKIEIGEKTIVTFGTKIIDTNFHYIIDLETKKIFRKSRPIHIGNRNWISNNVTIMKGTITPDDCIVASGSFLNKDYGCESNIVLAGIPAKTVRHNKKRLFKCDNLSVLEEEVDDFFYKKDKEYLIYE